jgi:DNA-binding response OmpR family regulator
MKGTILLHESDSELRKVVALHLEHLKWRVLQSKTVEFAMRLLEREEPKILISEFDPPYIKKGRLINRFRKINENGSDSILILMVLDHVDRELLDKFKPEIVIHKPFDVRNVSRNINRLLDKRER